MGGADVKNYILPYYRSSSCAWPEATVLPLPQSGTTAPTERYYRKGLRYYRSEEQYYRMPQISNTRSPSFCREDHRGKR